MKRYLPFALIGVVLLLALGSGVWLFRFKMRAATAVKVAAGKPGAEPAHVRGADRARITLEEFGDFQCPPCIGLSVPLKKLETDYASQVRVIFREYPLRMHKYAEDAARAAEAAGLQARFWEMHDLLFQNSAEWVGEKPGFHFNLGMRDPLRRDPAAAARAAFNHYAETLGLDLERFNNDLASEAVKARIESDQARAASLGVDRTPALYINGRQIPPQDRTEEKLRAAIEEELKK